MSTALIVANQTLPSQALADAMAEQIAQGVTAFHVVVPATPVASGFTWDEDESRREAGERLELFLLRLRALSVEATGEVGDRDPVSAVRDAIRGREIDEVVLSTLPPGISRWLGLDIPSRCGARSASRSPSSTKSGQRRRAEQRAPTLRGRALPSAGGAPRQAPRHPPDRARGRACPRADPRHARGCPLVAGLRPGPGRTRDDRPRRGVDVYAILLDGRIVGGSRPTRRPTRNSATPGSTSSWTPPSTARASGPRRSACGEVPDRRARPSSPHDRSGGCQ